MPTDITKGRSRWQLVEQSSASEAASISGVATSRPRGNMVTAILSLSHPPRRFNTRHHTREPEFAPLRGGPDSLKRP